MQLKIEMPDTAFSVLRISPDEFGDELKRAAAVKWYEMKKISQAKGAEICGVSRAEFLQILSLHHVSALQYDEVTAKEEVFFQTV